MSAHSPSEYNPELAKIDPSQKLTAEDLWAEKKKGLGREEKKAIKKGILILVAVIFIILVFVISYEIKKISFNETNASISISGPDQARSGKLLTYEINYQNSNLADLEKAVLKISYPDNLKPDDTPNFIVDSPTSGHFDLGTIKGKNSGKVIFNGKAFSPKGALIYLKAVLNYQPKNFNSQFETDDQLGINVISSPLSLEIQAPQNVASGDEVNYLVAYRNDGAETFENLKIKIDYPEQFSFSSSDLKTFEGNNIWYIGNLSSGQEGKIIINGKLEGDRDQIKSAQVFIGADNKGEFLSYNEESADTKIISSPLLITQTVNGVADLKVNAGDTLKFEINYRNNGNIGLKDVIVKETIDSTVLDYGSLKISGGSFDMDNKMITWKAPDVANLKILEPGQVGKISFSIKVKEVIPVASENDKNFVISSVAKIDSPDIPTPISMNKIISGNAMDIKLNSKLVLTVKGYHTDPNISNFGPIPPKVGEETSYVIHWLVANVSNDINNAKVEANIPTNAVMTGTTFPDDARITYNERNNSIVWEIGTIKAGTGIISAPQEVSFQVKIKPSPDQAGKEVSLLGESKLTAKDLFTGEDLSQTAGKKTTNLIEDKTIVDGNRVAN